MKKSAAMEIQLFACRSPRADWFSRDIGAWWRKRFKIGDRLLICFMMFLRKRRWRWPVCASDGGFLPIAFSACYFLIHGAESWLRDRARANQLYSEWLARGAVHWPLSGWIKWIMLAARFWIYVSLLRIAIFTLLFNRKWTLTGENKTHHVRHCHYSMQ